MPDEPIGLLSNLGKQYPEPEKPVGLLSQLANYLSPSNQEWAPWPVRMARSAVGAVMLPGDVYQGKVSMYGADGRTNPEVINRSSDLAGLMMMGATGAPAGALGSGAVRRAPAALPMDEASRMARAQDAGFYTNMPLFHGTADDFRAFDLNKGGRTTGAAPARQGVWLADDPSLAEEFARQAASKTGNDPSIMPLLHRSERPAQLTLKGTELDHEIAATLSQAWADGYTSVLLKNYTSPDGKTGQSIFVVKDPNQLRSPAAKFDPKKKNSSDLLAGILPTTSSIG